MAQPHMRTLDRYVIRETILPFCLALAVLTFLFAVQPMMLQAQALLAKGAPLGTVVYLLIVLLPQALGITLPMAFLIGLLIALGRLSADREAVALLACGVSLWRMLRPALIMATLVGLATLYVMIEAIPAGNTTFIQVTGRLLVQKAAQEIKPGVFYQGFPGKVLFVSAARPDGVWEKVMLATTRDQGLPSLVLADEGRLIIDREQNRVEIILQGHVSKRLPATEAGVYDVADQGGAIERYQINPLDVFPKVDIQGGIHEMTIAELKVEQAGEIQRGESTHPTVIAIHQKFSFPVACLVMGLVGIAVGIHTRRDGKFASFALGLALIFLYYGLMQIFESLAKGLYFPAYLARWVPNIVLGIAAAAVIWWRSENAERSVGIPMPRRLAAFLARFGPEGRSTGEPTKTVVVVRVPDIGLPRPKLIDIYLMRQYVTVVSLAFVGLLGLFYIGTIVDLSDKLFKSNATTGMLLDFLWYSTPQYVYYLIPIAILVAVLVTIGTLAKTSELTVLRACGVSLYRLAGPMLVFGALWSGVLFGLEEYVMAASNKNAAVLDRQFRGQAPTTVDLTQHHWMVGTEGRYYYYETYSAKQRIFLKLSVYELAKDGYRISRHTFVDRAQLTRAGWTGGPGWTQSFDRSGAPREAFKRRALRLDAAKYFETDQAEAQAMTVGQLRDYIRELKANDLNVAAYQMDLQRKIAAPLMTLVMTLIALPLGVTTGKRGALYGIGLAIALAFAYQIAITAFGVLGAAELLPATLAAWAPNLLFLAGASYLLLTVRT